MNALNTFEIGILDFIQEHFACKVLDILMPIISMFADGGIFWIAVAVLMLCFRRTRKTGFKMGAALLMGLIICNITLKPIIGRTRPYNVNTAFDNLLVKELSDGSFPSGHTLASFEAAVVLLICDKRFGYPALGMAIAVALSRLYLYVHYPTDVLTSVLLGSVFAVISCRIVDALYKKYAKNELEPENISKK